LGKQIEGVLFPGGVMYGSNTFPNKVNDVDHLVGHKLANRDIFVTNDVRIIKKASDLAALGITVMTPAEALTEIKRRL